MSIDIVMISTLSRPMLTIQAMRSLDTAIDLDASMTLVLDAPKDMSIPGTDDDAEDVKCIINAKRVGASRSRNIGASSIPKYRRRKYVMFVDDDVYMCPGWDITLLEIMAVMKDAIISGHAHPYNRGGDPYQVAKGHVVEPTKVLSTVHMIMPWDIWDKVGFFTEPGGPGGSEDVDYCRRAAQEAILAVTLPHVVLHCGLTSTNGHPIVGYAQMVEQNDILLHHYGLDGQVLIL